MSHAMLMVLAALGGELLLVSLGLLSFSWWRNRAARRRDDQAVRALVERVKEARGEREASIARFLGEHMGMSGEALTRAQADLLRAELQLLQRLAVVYKRRDAQAAADLDRDLYAALASYHALRGAHGSTPTEAAHRELEGLRAENQRLTEELRSAMENMSRMVNDFSSMLPAATSPVETSPADTVGGGPEAESFVAPPPATHGATPHLEEGPVEVVGFDEGDGLDAVGDDGVFEASEPTDAADGDSELETDGASPQAEDDRRQAKGRVG